MSCSPVFWRRVVGSLAVIAACAWLERGVTGAEAKVDPQAAKAIDAFGKYFAGLKAFSLQVNIDLKVEQQGNAQNIKFEQKISAERPNKFAYVYDAATGGANIISDGKELSVAIKGLQKYGVEKAPEGWAGILENQIVQGVLGMGNTMPVTAALFSDDPAKKLIANAETVEYGGVVELGEFKCHLIKASGADLDWQLWIDAGKSPLPRQFVPDVTKTFARVAKAQNRKSPFEGMKISNTVTYSEWDLAPKFGDETFVFTAPEGATKAGSLMQMLTGGARQEGAPHALLGQPAPPVELDLLGGGKLNLASYKDKSVVILDFWATWCGPCVQAMPVIEKVAEKYKDKGVLLFAVNIREQPEEIEKFLKEAEIKVPVALDIEGSVGEAYLANAIPQTVLIGKDGSVQVVKVGLSTDLESALSKDLEALLAGKDLAAKTLADFKAKSEAAAKEAEAAPDSDAKDAKDAKKQSKPESDK